MGKGEEVLNKKILIIDDNPNVVEILSESLSRSGAIVFSADNGEEGLRCLYQHRPDLVLLDIAMPVMDGWETCRRIRDISSVPIIMITALDDENDIVLGLDLGAVDYIVKPFSTRILHARVNAALRQARTRTLARTEHLYEDAYLKIDLDKREVFAAGTAVHLSKTEFALLDYLLRQADKPVPSQKIIDNVWGENYFDGIKNLYVYISQLRQKLEKNPSAPDYILTEYGVGYRFKKQPSLNPGLTSNPRQNSLRNN